MGARKALCKPHLAFSETKLALLPGSAAHPVQNSPSKRPWQANPVQNSPSEPQNADFGPFCACRENFVPFPPPTIRAGRTLYRFRHQHDKQGELYPARRATSGTKLSQPPGSPAHPVQNSPSTPGSPANPVQNSPGTPQNADFGPFCASRENFLPLPPPTTRAGRKKSRTNTPPHPNNASLSKFRMQFDCMNFQQSPETLQSQRSQFKSQNTPRGIACEIDEAGFERAGGSGGHGRAPEKPAAVSAGSGRAKTEQKSHIISCGHFSRPPTNGAIATIQIHGLKHAQGNYVRNC